MNVTQFDRFFTERIAEPIRARALVAIATAKTIAFGCWFDGRGNPCLVLLAGQAAVGERWKPASKDVADACAFYEQKAAAALGVTPEEIQEIWVFWDNQMTPATRLAFQIRMAAHQAVEGWRSRNEAPAAEFQPAYA